MDQCHLRGTHQVTMSGSTKPPETTEQRQRKRTGPKGKPRGTANLAWGFLPGQQDQCPRQEGASAPSPTPLLCPAHRSRLPGEGERAGPQRRPRRKLVRRLLKPLSRFNALTLYIIESKSGDIESRAVSEPNDGASDNSQAGEPRDCRSVSAGVATVLADLL